MALRKGQTVRNKKTGKLQFKTFKGKNTDILHSQAFATRDFKSRRKLAFNKNVRQKLSNKDKWLLTGYAFAKDEQFKAYAYKKKRKSYRKKK